MNRSSRTRTDCPVASEPVGRFENTERLDRHGHSTRRLISWCLVLVGMSTAVPGAAARDPNLKDIVRQTLRELEIKPQTEKPSWAQFPSPPLFTFAWMSDFHLDRSRVELVKQAFRYVDAEVKPNFVMITGDNNTVISPAEYRADGASLGLMRQKFMKRFLDQNLHTPYVIIPGDNWPEDFEKVFGAFQFSFDCGGVHFLFASLDRCAYGMEGQAVFDPPTWRWMRADLKRNETRPCLFVMHESVVPPSFLDAVRTRKMLEEYPQTIACLCGHLHADVQFREGRIKYIVCPGLGVNPRHGFKVVTVCREALIFRTIEYDAQRHEFAPVMKWQRIDIPERLQSGLHKTEPGSFVKQNYSEVPPHPRADDPRLVQRSLELVGPLMLFLGQHMGSHQP